MKKTKLKMISIPSFKLPNRLEFSGGKLSEDIEYLGTGEPDYKLSPKSLTHADQAALYYLGLYTKMGIKTGAPQKAKEAAVRHYEAVHKRRGKGNWSFDAIDYDMDVPILPGTRLPEGYEILAWVKKPRWVQKGKLRVPVIGDKSELIYAEMPPEGFGPVPTIYGLRDPRTGWVLATVPNKNNAIDKLAENFAKYMNKVKARKLAEKEVSYSYRRQKGNGKSAVCRDSSPSDYGPFLEDADWDAGHGYEALGAFLFSSSGKKR